ncbi:holo-ACP synthase [Lacicoccus qingdaonensis]|uniref:Holo-[acyl-carrier-protein] synthase n=1 Tax=Lacicoccus qingdaonensis TaxID=576118 RepID=A0A1G9HYX5_9BACL|nr:holo-ACP synthase [Salinicoccus qingdaonensis]SDL18179.1 holo-[acyl-carrier protein] synthase [Salinicoccus qingdaonensis]
MIIGLGTDIIEISRIKKVNKDHRLARRILSDVELDKYMNIKSDERKTEFLAGRFAVKEAYSKALGSGIGKTVAFKEIRCLNDSQGKPSIADDRRAHVSISHAEEYAVATVVLETQ